MEENQEQEEVVKTYTEQEVEDLKAQIKAENESKFDEKFNKRWAQEQRKYAKENAEKEDLINLLKEQTNTDSLDELLNLSYKQYGKERPKNVFNEKDEEVLGKNDAKEILELDIEQIEEEANKLAGIKNRTARENATFKELGSYLTAEKSKAKRKKEIKEAGIEEDILNDGEFQTFMGKFKDNTSMKEIYDIYKGMNAKTKPFSAGSLKDNKIKETDELFSEEEFKNLTSEDLKNPQIYEKAMRSRLSFK